VPVVTGCNVNPAAAALSEEQIAAVERTLAWSREQHILPNIRVNYRDYGLDERTRRYLLEHIVK
jgi:hypothetical protein